MMDRFRACSPLVALAIASVCALSACEQQSKPDDVTSTSRPLTSGLQAGDIAITCFDTQNPDSLQITPLVTVDANTRILYTDREANADGVFNNNDNENLDQMVTIPSPTDAGTVPPGIPVTFIPTTGLNNGTEQVFLYQGHIGIDVDGGNADAAVQDPNTQLIWGMQVSPGGAWVPRDDAANLSDLPTSLHGHALALPSSGDAGAFGAFYYDTTKGPTHGTKAVLQAAFANSAYWTSVAGPVVCSNVVTATFTVDPDVDSGTDAPIGSNDGAAGAPGGDGGGTDGTGTIDSGTGGAPGNDGGAGGTAGTDGGAADTGAGGAGGNLVDAHPDEIPEGGQATDAKADTGSTVDAKADTGSTPDAKADTGSTADAKPDTGSTGGTDAKPADAGKDSGTTAKSSSSGCGCSTASNSQNLSASVSLLALAGIVMTARRRRRR